MDLIVRCGEREEKVHVEKLDDGYRVRIGETEYTVDLANPGGPDPGGPVKSLVVEGQQLEVAVYAENHNRYTISTHRGTETVEIMDPLSYLAAESHGGGKGGVQQITAYMPGRVVKLLAQEGDEVEAGQGLVVLEAMKMENEIQAEAPGVVKRVLVEDGQPVDGGDLLFEIE